MEPARPVNSQREGKEGNSALSLHIDKFREYQYLEFILNILIAQLLGWNAAWPQMYMDGLSLLDLVKLLSLAITLDTYLSTRADTVSQESHFGTYVFSPTL